MAESTFYSQGFALDYTPGTAKTAGDLVDLGNGLVGQVINDIAANTLGAVHIRGVIKATKEAGGGVSFTRGAIVGWDDSGKTAVAEADGDFLPGVAAAAAADGDSYVLIVLNQLPYTAPAA